MNLSFEKGHFLKMYTSFFKFLENPEGHNVTMHEAKGHIQFSLRQGSGRIEGHCNMKGIQATSIIASADVLPLGLMRQLLEQNFNLKYCRYALDSQNRLCLIFDTFSADGPPHKLYQGLREMALEADRQDDMLVREYPEIHTAPDQSIAEISIHEKKTKFQFMRKWAAAAIHEIDNNKLNAYMYPGSISFILLDFLYKLDYLIAPEGSLKEDIRDLHIMYFETNELPIYEKNAKILKVVRSLENMDEMTFFKMLYPVNNTFGFAEVEGHQKFAGMVDAHRNDLQWYFDNQHLQHVQAIAGYLIGYSLYAFSLPEPTKALLFMYFRIIENEFFQKLGYTEKLIFDDVRHLKQIKQEIAHTLTAFREEYGKVNADTSILDMSNAAAFSRSYLIMVRNLQYEEEYL